ncbi:glycoside hydrolase family 24 protein [Vreelandella sp. GE22]
MPVITPAQAGGINVCAFLDMLAFAELHTPMLNDPRTDNGYRVIVGSLPGKLNLMESYDDHPRQLVTIRKGLSSTAAGRYQILSRFWDHYKKTLGLPDFGPLNQDKYAIQQLREQRALALIKAGRITDAIARCANIWASLPGAGYGQHEHTVKRLVYEFQQAKGVLCEADKTWYERALLKKSVV